MTYVVYENAICVNEGGRLISIAFSVCMHHGVGDVRSGHLFSFERELFLPVAQQDNEWIERFADMNLTNVGW